MKKTLLALCTILLCLCMTACAAAPAENNSTASVQLTTEQKEDISDSIRDMLTKSFAEAFDSYEISDFSIEIEPYSYRGYPNAVMATVKMDYTSASDPQTRPAILAMNYVRDLLTDPEQKERVQKAIDGLLAEYESYEADYGSHTDDTYEFLVDILDDDNFTYSLYYLYTSSDACVTPVPAAHYFETAGADYEKQTAYGIRLAMEALYQTETD